MNERVGERVREGGMGQGAGGERKRWKNSAELRITRSADVVA